MSSLTKKTLLAELAVSKPERLPVKLFGHEVWVKPVSEFQRSRRLSSLYTKNGEVDREALRMSRLYAIVDHLCDKDGEPLFKEADVKELLEVDSLKLDLLTDAIETWAEKREGKLKGGSKS